MSREKLRLDRRPEKIFVPRSSPLSVSVPLDSLDRFCSGWFAIPAGFIFQW
jgi:hypothetical protein